LPYGRSQAIEELLQLALRSCIQLPGSSSRLPATEEAALPAFSD
jgi:hypothetical protein